MDVMFIITFVYFVLGCRRLLDLSLHSPSLPLLVVISTLRIGRRSVFSTPYAVSLFLLSFNLDRAAYSFFRLRLLLLLPSGASRDNGLSCSMLSDTGVCNP